MVSFHFNSTKCGNSSGVEHNLAKVGVASSNLVSRSIFCPGGGMVDTRDLKSLGNYFRAGSSPALGTTSIWRHGQVVRQKPAKLLPPVRIWVSPPYYTGFICVIYFVLLSCYYADVLILGTESKRILKMPMNGLKKRSIKVLVG